MNNYKYKNYIYTDLDCETLATNFKRTSTKIASKTNEIPHLSLYLNVDDPFDMHAQK